MSLFVCSVCAGTFQKRSPNQRVCTAVKCREAADKPRRASLKRRAELKARGGNGHR